MQYRIMDELIVELLIFWALSLTSICIIALYFRRNRQRDSFAFFHPYCDAGGGGERVLWRALNAMHQQFPQLKFVVYTGDLGGQNGRTTEQILEKARSRFNLTVNPDRLQFVPLRFRWLLEASNYPRLTLLGQMFAGIVVGIEALWRHSPQWFMDTTGCPMTLPVFRLLAGSISMAYVHYPIITVEMMNLVESREASHNNSTVIASSQLLTRCKLAYYWMIALLYHLCGRCCQLAMVNGSWTCNHLATLWRCQPHIVYPPCNVETLTALANRSEEKLMAEGEEDETKEENAQRQSQAIILSVGQIRPEKNHLEQLRIFAEVRRRLKEQGSSINLKLVIAGGCRDQGDQRRVEFLQNYARGNFQMEPGKEVDWALNIPFFELTKLMQDSLIGLHTMWNEHFGISVVEGMAAGQIMVAHNSGGPKLDIIGPEEVDEDESNRCGFLASTREKYVTTILHILLKMDTQKRDQIREAARQKAQRFSDQNFDENFCCTLSEYIGSENAEDDDPSQRDG